MFGCNWLIVRYVATREQSSMALVKCSYSLISTKTSPDFSSSIARARVVWKISFSLVLDVFPQVTQRICGGVPNSSCSLTKSPSLVITIAPAIFAAANISRSVASLNPRSRSARASTANFSCIYSAMDGGNCASTQKIMPPGWDDPVSSRHTVIQPGYLRFASQASLPVFARRSGRQRGARAHRSHVSACRECKGAPPHWSGLTVIRSSRAAMMLSLQSLYRVKSIA